MAEKIQQYLCDDKHTDPFKKASVYLEEEFLSVLDGWGISPGDLQPQYDDFTKKAKNILQQKLSASVKPRTRRVSEKIHQRNLLVSRMHEAFKKTDISQTNILHYIAHILTSCGIESDSQKVVFEKIRRQFYRNPVSPQYFESTITR